jgi:hypothetical protein
MPIARSRTIVRMNGGDYVAYTDVVDCMCKAHTKSYMVRTCAELWPELLRDGSWTMTWLRSQPKYVLAVILNQLGVGLAL